MTHEPRSALHDLEIEARSRSQGAPIEKLAYRVAEAAHALAISRSRLYELIGSGEIKILKDGGRTLIRRSELEAYLLRLEEASLAAKPGRRQLPNRP